jgi:hypothetical protein
MGDLSGREALADALRRTFAAGSARCILTATSGRTHGALDFAHDASAWSSGDDPGSGQDAIYIRRRVFWLRPGGGWDKTRLPRFGPSTGLGFATEVLHALDDRGWRVEPEVARRADVQFRLTRTDQPWPHAHAIERSLVFSLDADGRIRHIEERRGPVLDEGGDIVLEADQKDYEFSDYGTPVVIQPPRQGEIASITTEDDLRSIEHDLKAELDT